MEPTRPLGEGWDGGAPQGRRSRNPPRYRESPSLGIDRGAPVPEVTDEEIIAHLSDGRTISVPLAWSWRLNEAAPEERENFRLIAAGQGIHWPDIDEDISIQGMLAGIPAPRPAKKDS